MTLLIAGLGARDARADIVWAMENAGDGHLWKIDVGAGTHTLIGAIRDPILGDVGGGWSTVAETPDGTLYFLRRFVNDVNVFKVDSNNIVVNGSGVITNLTSLGSTGLGGNLDGLTAGPDGNLYFTAFQNDHAAFPTNGLFRFNPLTDTTTTVGTFAGGNQFYTDLAFDPITGNLFGTGNGGSQIYELSGATAENVSNQIGTLPYNVLYAAAGFDGLAFDRLTGQMFESSDSGGVFEVNRATGTFIQYIGGTQGTGIGADLAVQADTIQNFAAVPEPGTLTLLGIGLAAATRRWRKTRRGPQNSR